jgi:HSP20 family protein
MKIDEVYPVSFSAALSGDEILSKREERRNQEESSTARRMPRSTIEPYRNRGGRLTQPTNFEDIFDQFKRSFDQLVEPFMPFTGEFSLGRPWEEMAVRAPLTDLADKGDHYLVTVELPGFKKDEVDVEVNKDTLRIYAEKKEETKQEDKDIVHRERAYTVFERRLVFPEEVLPQNVEATMHDGILELKVPKKEPRPEEQSTKVPIK